MPPMLCYAEDLAADDYAMKIRPAQLTDLETAAALWYQRVALLRESGNGVNLAPNAIEQWRNCAHGWVSGAEFAFYVAESDEGIVGLVVATTKHAQAGLYPERAGVLLELVVDLHQAHNSLSGRLIAAAKSWLRVKGIAVLEIQCPANYPVEDAFWRAHGASLSARNYRLRI